jgi:hypothetical protein
MTATVAQGAPDRTRWSRVLPWLLVLGGLVLVAVIAGGPDDSSGVPFDPASAEPNGTRALVEVLESFDAEVDTTSVVPRAETDVALVLADTLDESAVTQIESWVRDGGTLVVADPFSVFTPQLAAQLGSFGASPEVDVGTCDIDALADLARVDPGRAVTYELREGDRSCFGGAADAYVAESSFGDGTVISLVGPELFTNELLDEADNAALAARLLVPEPRTRVAVLQPGDGEGSVDRSLTDVLSTGVRAAMVQLVVAFGVYAWYRARRLGRPVLEPQPVEVAGSELVLAVGQLLQQTKDPNRAARLLRSDLRRRLVERLGVPSTTEPEVIAEIVVARTGLTEATARTAVIDLPVADDDALLELARTIESVRLEVLHEPSARRSTG